MHFWPRCVQFSSVQSAHLSGSICAFWFDIPGMAAHDARGRLAWTSLGIIFFLRSLSSKLRVVPAHRILVKTKGKKKGGGGGGDVGHGSDSHVPRFLGGSATKASCSNKFNAHANAVRSLNKISIPYTC